MKIAIDYRPAISKGTGVGTFIENLTRSLAKNSSNDEICLFASSLKKRIDKSLWDDCENVSVRDFRIPVKVLNYFWHRLQWPPVDRLVGACDLAFSPSPLIMPTKGKTIVTLHDLYFLEQPEHTTAEIRRDYVGLVRRHAASADAILSVSQSTKDRAVELLSLPEDQITVCLEDCSPYFDVHPAQEELEKIDSEYPQPYFLFVGTIEPRKNLTSLLKAFNIIATEHQEVHLVIAGAHGWQTETFDKTLQKLENRKRISITGYCSRSRLRALYHRATALIMPSHCEGFGLPLVEAMACGCPLIVNNNSALPEVAGDAALYWNSSSAEDLAELMLTIWKNQQTRERMIRNGIEQRKKFSWQATAQIVRNVFERLI